MASGDTKTLIETGVRRFQEQVPALQQLKLVVGLELRGRGDVQLYRVEVPGPKVTKDVAADARVRLTLPRADFNTLATEGDIGAWRDAFVHGHAKANGPARDPPAHRTGRGAPGGALPHQEGHPLSDVRFRMPAEWAPHERTLMAWPCRLELWGDRMAEAKARLRGGRATRSRPSSRC